MRDIKRIEPLLETLRKIWLQHPDYRLTQLLGNVYGPIDPYYIEDDVLMERLKEYRKLMRQAEGETRA